MINGDAEKSLYIFETIIYYLLASLFATLYHPVFRNGVAVVGGSNPLAPTIFTTSFLLFTQRESKNDVETNGR